MENEKRFDSLEDKVTLDDGTQVSIRLEYDDTISAPWKEYDGHGIVSEWRSLDSKAPGERVLAQDQGRALFYDMEATTKKARAEGWGCGDTVKHVGHAPHKTEGERVACAVEQDYQNLRAFAEGRWHYVGVVLDLERNGWTKRSAASVWGVEDYDRAFVLSTANELLGEVEA